MPTNLDSTPLQQSDRQLAKNRNLCFHGDGSTRGPQPDLIHLPEKNNSDEGVKSFTSGSKKGKRMDPFEVRIRFTQHLQNLNASVTSANKAAQYALKFKDMDEDLHSCILEQLERVCAILEKAL
jgi:hypothetical protein